MSELVPAPEVIEGRVVESRSTRVRARGWTAGPVSVTARTTEDALELLRQGLALSKREWSYEWPPQTLSGDLRKEH